MKTEDQAQGKTTAREVAVLTVVLRLPDDPEERREITSALSLGGDFKGAHITAMSMEDEITVNEYLEDAVDEGVVQEARQRAKVLHQQL